MSSTNIEELSSKVVKDSTTPKRVRSHILNQRCSKVVKDSTTPKLHPCSIIKKLSSKVVKDSTTPKRLLYLLNFLFLFKSS